jgi:hypothetical protein
MQNGWQIWNEPVIGLPEALSFRPASFVFEHQGQEKQVRSVLRRLPPLRGEPIVIAATRGLRDGHGPVHAGSFLRIRRIAFDCTRMEFPRVFVHELFHFAWPRCANATRRSFEQLLAREWKAGARGELGWSSEWRKQRLAARDVVERSRRWREYCCESFCDTAAWLYCGMRSHDEFTLDPPFRRGRRGWFRKAIGPRGLSI